VSSPQKNDGQDGTFGILIVCTGNICRSPFAEILTRHLLAEALGAAHATRFTVASAGTRALTGWGMDEQSRAELAPWGLDGASADGFAARQLGVADVHAADLVLTAERHHRAYVVALEPRALRRTFCLRELSRLLGANPVTGLPADPVDRARAMVSAAAETRGLSSYASVENDALPDPIGQPPAAHHRTARLIAASVAGLVELVAPDSGRAGRDSAERDGAGRDGSPPAVGEPAAGDRPGPPRPAGTR
jgi:protein-tyrosine phosphatase